MIVLPISQNYADYSLKVFNQLKESGFRVEFDDRNEKIGYRIREAETKKIRYMIILGDKEKESGSISIRKHKEGDQGSLALSEFIDKIASEIKNKV